MSSKTREKWFENLSSEEKDKAILQMKEFKELNKNISQINGENYFRIHKRKSLHVLLVISLIIIAIIIFKSDKSKFVNIWQIEAFVIGSSSPLANGTMEFQDDNNILLLVNSGGKQNSKVLKWKYLGNDSIMIDKRKYKYKFSSNRLRLQSVEKKYNDVFIDLKNESN